MQFLKSLIRPEILSLAPYKSAREEAGSIIPDIAIDANESPWPPFGPLATTCNVNRYPEPQPQHLIERLSVLWNISCNKIILGRGSDDGIDWLIRMCCRAGRDSILICPPTFGMYEVYANIQGAETIKAPLNREGQIDLIGIQKHIKPNTKLIFIPSPNAPMGHQMKKSDILSLCERYKDQVLIVVDEAYIEFTDTPEGLTADLHHYSNLAILRTLSKAHALAGERLGAVLAHPAIVVELNKVRAAYPLTQSSIRICLDALSANGLVDGEERRKIIVKERDRMSALLSQSPFVRKVYSSCANFVLIEVTNVSDVMLVLRKYGILARDRSRDIANTLRLSISTPSDNDLVLKAFGVAVVDKIVVDRLYSYRRTTKETNVDVTINLDQTDFLQVHTGIGFFDHMCTQLAAHGGFGLVLNCKGDLEVDQHHTVEDCALALGETLKRALGDKRGINRFGFNAPLDEALAQVTLDLSGRPYVEFKGCFPADNVGGLSCEMIPHFFQSLAASLGASIHISVDGHNTHHMIEACFKATGRALKQAFQREGMSIPSTKGVL